MQLNKKGFSLIEIAIVIAILIVLLGVLAPTLLRYTENSRAQKDASAMDEICNVVQIAMSDANCFDEMYRYKVDNNFITYSDSSGVYGAQYIDEEFWAPDGAGKATTITFNPGENGVFTFSEAIVNDMTYGNGSIAPTRIIEGAQLKDVQCSLINTTNGGNAKGLLYHKLASSIGENIQLSSQTYKNSSYTVFIQWSRVAGMPHAEVYGMFNGTNLNENCPASLGTGTDVMPEEGLEPEPVTPPTHQTPSYDNSALTGGGTVPTPNRDYVPESDKGATVLSKSKLGNFVTANNPKIIEFTTNVDATGEDVSEDGQGGVVAYMTGSTCYVASTKPSVNVRAPADSSSLFDGEKYGGYKTVERLLANSLDTSKVTSLKRAFYYFGVNSNMVSLDIAHWDTSQVTSMDSMFLGAARNAALFGMNVSKWDVGKVKTFHWFMYTACQQATDWYIGDLSKWNVSSCEDFTGMFYWCGMEAQSWDIGNLQRWNVSKCKTFGYMFVGAGQHSDEWHIGDISNWHMSQATYLAGMFSETGRRAVSWYVGDLGKWDVSNVTDFYHMFWYASTDTDFNPGNIQRWDTSSAINMEAMFYPVRTSSTIDLSNWNVDSVTNHVNFESSPNITPPRWIS